MHGLKSHLYSNFFFTSGFNIKCTGDETSVLAFPALDKRPLAILPLTQEFEDLLS